MLNLELILDKIAPPLRLPRVSRPRLLQLLEKSLAAGTCTIISGRARTGKTALAVDFSLQCKRDVAWYKVDAPDIDPAVFFSYLIKSVQRCRPDFGVKSLVSLSEFAGPESMIWLADAFVYDLAEGSRSEPLLIVIEDLHLVSDADWLVTFFGRLLPLLPSDVHLLITSRNLPTAPLWRLRSKQFLVVIDEPSLSFTRPEAILLFESYGLTGDQACIALDHTHGRAGAMDESAIFLRAASAPLTAEANVTRKAKFATVFDT